MCARLLSLFLSALLLACVPGEIKAEKARVAIDSGMTFAKKGDWKQARDQFRKALVAEPYNDEAAFRLAQSLIHLHENASTLREARKLLDASVEKNDQVFGPKPTDDLTTRKPPVPALAIRLFYLGLARWGLDDRTGALSAFERALRADPSLREAAYNRVSILLELGRDGEAVLEETESLKKAQKPAK